MAAVYTKPTKLPLWAMTTTNILEPPAGKKDDGWELDEVPPSEYENWRTKNVAEWFQWFNERFFDGTYGATPKESMVVQANGVDCVEFTEDGPLVLTDVLGLSADSSFGTVKTATFAAIGFDALVDPNTSLIYDRVADEFLFKIADTVAVWALDSDGYMRINNLSGSSTPPTFAMLDRRGSNGSGKQWLWQVDGPNGTLQLEQFTQGGASEGLALELDGSTVLKRWKFLTSGTYGVVLEPATDYLTDLAGFIGSPSKRWTEMHTRLVYEAEPPHLYAREDATISIPDNSATDIMPRSEILAQSMTVNDTTRRLTMPVEKGRYKLDFVLRMKASSAGLNVLFQLLKNGSNEVPSPSSINAIDFPNAGEYQLIPLTFMVQVDALTDYFQLTAYHNGGGGVTATCDEESRLTAVCVRRDP